MPRSTFKYYLRLIISNLIVLLNIRPLLMTNRPSVVQCRSCRWYAVLHHIASKHSEDLMLPAPFDSPNSLWLNLLLVSYKVIL